AASKQAQGHGVLAVLNDEIHHATMVEKMHKGLASAFQSPNGGPVGYVMEGVAHLLHAPAPATRLGLEPKRFARVALVKVSLDDEPDLLQAVQGLGYEGVVIEGMGAGHVPERWVPVLDDLVKQMPIVLASRVIA